VAFYENSKLRPTKTYIIVKTFLCHDRYNEVLLHIKNTRYSHFKNYTRRNQYKGKLL